MEHKIHRNIIVLLAVTELSFHLGCCFYTDLIFLFFFCPDIFSIFTVGKNIIVG